MTKVGIAIERPTACNLCPLRRNASFKVQKESDISAIQSLKTGERFVRAGLKINAEKSGSNSPFTILEGWAFRYRLLDGDRRQITEIMLPGDFVGFQYFFAEDNFSGVMALTDVRLCEFGRDRLLPLYAEHPSLAYELTRLAAKQEQALDERLLTLGQRTASERIAYLLWCLYDRARHLNLVEPDGLQLPLRQYHIAETLGLSLLHTNKTLRKITAAGIIRICGRRIVIVDEDGLVSLGRIDTKSARQRLLI